MAFFSLNASDLESLEENNAEKEKINNLLKQHEETFTRFKLSSEQDAQVFAKLELSRLKNKRLSERKIK